MFLDIVWFLDLKNCSHEIQLWFRVAVTFWPWIYRLGWPNYLNYMIFLILELYRSIKILKISKPMKFAKFKFTPFYWPPFWIVWMGQNGPLTNVILGLGPKYLYTKIWFKSMKSVTLKSINYQKWASCDLWPWTWVKVTKRSSIKYPNPMLFLDFVWSLDLKIF